MRTRDEIMADAILVLSYIPYQPCGTTAAMLAEAAYDDKRRGCEIYSTIKSIEDKLSVDIQKATCSSDGFPGAAQSHYWVAASPENRKRCEKALSVLFPRELIGA